MQESKNIEQNFDKSNEKLHIPDVSFSLWEYGTCWVKSPVSGQKTTHKSRRNKETKVVEFYVDDKTCDSGEGYWLVFNKGWWNNFIPTNSL